MILRGPFNKITKANIKSILCKVKAKARNYKADKFIKGYKIFTMLPVSEKAEMEGRNHNFPILSRGSFIMRKVWEFNK